MAEQLDALQRLTRALAAFRESGWDSEGSGNKNDPYAGMDPDDLACESVEPGGEIHNAVCAVQPFYGGKLPAPKARNPWLELQWACRHVPDPLKRQIEAHRHAEILQDWVRSEVEQKPTETSSATTTEPIEAAKLADDQPLDRNQATILDCLAMKHPVLCTNEEIEEILRPNLKVCLSLGTIAPCVSKLIDAGYLHRPFGDRKGAALTDKGRAKAATLRAD